MTKTFRNMSKIKTNLLNKNYKAVCDYSLLECEDLLWELLINVDLLVQRVWTDLSFAAK